MSLKANKSYLLDERSRLGDRIRQIEDFLGENPAKYVTIREIGGKKYCYLKFRKDGRYTSEYFGKGSGIDIDQIESEMEALRERRGKAKAQLKIAKSNLVVIDKQLRMIEKVL